MAITHLMFVAVNYVLAKIEFSISFVQEQTYDLPALRLRWPFPWLPHGPVLFAIAYGAATAIFFLAIKFTRWVYGLVPFAQ